MIRKILVAAIALIYMILGFLNFYDSLFPALSSSGLFLIRVFPLISSALAFYAGLSMFRLNEFGRKFVVLLLSVRVVINALLILQLSKGGASLGVQNRLGEIIHRIESPYAYPGFLWGWIVVALLAILFLSQKETKELFAFKVTKDPEPDIIFE